MNKRKVEDGRTEKMGEKEEILKLFWQEAHLLFCDSQATGEGLVWKAQFVEVKTV